MIKDILSYMYVSFDTFIMKVIYSLNKMQFTNSISYSPNCIWN